MFDPESTGLVVHKIGGTSIGKFANRVADIIASPSAIKRMVAIRHDVRTKKVLLDKLRTTIHFIRDEHISAVQSAVQSPDLQDEACQQIDEDCQQLLHYIDAAGRFDLDIDAHSKDRVISFGEKWSCRLMAAMLKDRQVDAEYIDLSQAMYLSILDYPQQKYFRRAADILAQHISTCNAQVPVVTGFFGSVPGGLLDGGIARGYSDVCAALVAVGLRAEKLCFWKEVDGILTANPAEVPTARLLSTISQDEANELTFYGSEVVHHLALSLALQAMPRIEVCIKNVQKPAGQGTMIIPDAPELPEGQIMPPDDSPAETGNMAMAVATRCASATAITIKRHITMLNIYSNRKVISHGFFAKVFSTLDSCNISVDLVATSEVYISMAIDTSDANEARVSAARLHLREVARVTTRPNMAILSLVGRQLKNVTGFTGRMFTILGESGVNIEMISQDSQVKFSSIG
ncbi:hypothetical protein DL771_002494 [Monosporascus sp. 5C6A]|nr:hypothetical protein DL771_002494 [Monosporascus sp. 5C6A]